MGETKFNIQTEEFTTLSIVSSMLTWRTTDTLKAKVVTNTSFTLNVTNLKNGMSGVLIVTVTGTGAPSITLSTGKTNLGAGRLTSLSQGTHIFCFQCDGSMFYWNLARYS